MFRNTGWMLRGLKEDSAKRGLETEPLQPYTLLMNKCFVCEYSDENSFHIQRHHEILFEQRAVYMIYSAISRMKLKRKKVRAGDLEAAMKCMVIVNALKHDWNERFTWIPNWHDRYLIVDDEVYLVGTSMDAQAANSSTFGIKRLTETKDKNIVIDTYVSYRDKIKDVSAPNSNGYKCTVKRGYV